MPFFFFSPSSENFYPRLYNLLFEPEKYIYKMVDVCIYTFHSFPFFFIFLFPSWRQRRLVTLPLFDEHRGAEGNDVLASAILFVRFLENLATSIHHGNLAENKFFFLSFFFHPLRRGPTNNRASNRALRSSNELTKFLSFFL